MGKDSEGRRVERDRLLRDLKWLAEGNPKYAGTDEEGEQNRPLARMMAGDLLLAYIDDEDVTRVFNSIRLSHSP
jgi:hypothetical protein